MQLLLQRGELQVLGDRQEGEVESLFYRFFISNMTLCTKTFLNKYLESD